MKNLGLLGAAMLANNNGDFFQTFGNGLLASSQAQSEWEKEQLERERQRKQDEMQRQLFQNQMADRQALGGISPQVFSALNPKKSALQEKMNLFKSNPQMYKGMGLGNKGTVIHNNVGTTKGQESYDKKWGEIMADFEAGGGYTDVMKNLAQLKEARQKLATQDNISGPIVGSVPDFAAPYLTPDAVNTKEQIEEVVQRNLRLILGAQFTQKEGERLISRAFNPKLDEATNLKRVDRLMQSIESALVQKQAAASYFKQNGTMAGFKGKMPTLEDFYTSIDSEAGGGYTQEDLEYTAEKHGITVDEVKRRLGIK